MRSRMSEPTSGWLVLRSDSVQPVHSWKWSQTTEGFFPFATFSAIFSPAHAGRPTAAAAALHTFTKSRRPSSAARVASAIPILLGRRHDDHRRPGVSRLSPRAAEPFVDFRQPTKTSRAMLAFRPEYSGLRGAHEAT